MSIKHDRKCWHCKTLFTTFNDTLPGCKCPQCGCEDTRRVKPSEALLQTAECRVTQLEAENERLREAMKTILDCEDCPEKIAREALRQEGGDDGCN